MTIQQKIVEPQTVEKELIKLWEEQGKEKVRACLFNLIVCNTLSERTDYVREIVRKISEKYPCRVLFITIDPKGKNALKTAVSLVGEGNIACDYIDIGVSGDQIDKVPFLLLPHFVPDLPISLLWTENPTKSHPLFEPLSQIASRIIFDSESADSLTPFAKKVLDLKEKTKLHLADLNWARTEQIRELIASLFHTGSKVYEIERVEIVYNEKKVPGFYHLKVQSLYILAWLAGRLGWEFQKVDADLNFTFTSQTATIQSETWENLGAAAIISIRISTKGGYLYEASRMKDRPHYAMIKTSSPEKCELPYQYVLGQTATGQSLAKEMITKGTSSHFLNMLEEILKMDGSLKC